MPNTRSQGSPSFATFQEPERELHERTRDFRERLEELVKSKVRSTSPVPISIMGDADPPARRTVHQRASEGVTGARSSITRPTIPNTNSWQIPSHVMSTITHATQFHGLEDEDAPGHLSRFARICDTFNITGVSKDAIYLRLFPFSLSGRASTWLDTLPDNSITTWEDLEAKFFKKYFPPSRAARLRDQIHSFRMDPDEPYHMAWERFNALLSRCPQHGLPDWALVEKFYNGLTFETQQMFNTAAGGHIMDRLEPEECEDMFESFAQAEQQHPRSVRDSIPTARSHASSPRGVHQVTPDTSVAAALASMANEIKELKLSALRCQVCRGGHDTRDCPVNNQEHVSYAGNQYQNRNYNNSNTFGSGWRSGFTGRQQQYGGAEEGASSGSTVGSRRIEEMMETQTQLLAQLVQNNKDARLRLDSHDTLMKNQQSAFQDLQRTVGDIARSIHDRQGSPSTGPNASVMAVSIESVESKVVEEVDPHSKEHNIPSVEEVNKIDWEARFAEIDARMLKETESNAVSTRSMIEKEDESPPVVVEEEPVEEEIVVEVPTKKAQEKKKGVEMKSPEIDLSRIPYPARVLPHKHAKEYGHFLDMFKQLKVNLPFVEVLQHMPKYAKFLKGLLSNKKKLEEVSGVSLGEQCSAVVQNHLPEKLPDSGRFTIPCLLGNLPLHHALADLGASINLMPYSLYKQLDLGEPQPTRMSISLADRSVKYPRGIVENLLVKVGNFVFPVDFVILDMEVGDKVPLILGRPFLRTAKAMIDVFDGKLTLRVGDEVLTFNAVESGKDVGEHSHSVCMLDSFIDHHWDSDPMLEVGEPAPNIEEPSEWALELERLLGEPDDYGDDEMPDDVLNIMAEFEDVMGKTPSVGKLVDIVEDPYDDPGESEEAIPLKISIPEPSHVLTLVCAEGRIEKPTPNSNPPRSRPPRKRTRESREVELKMEQTPSVGICKDDSTLGYLNNVIFGPGRFKLWWKDWIATCDMSLMFESSSCLLEESMLDSVRKIVGNEAPGLSRYARDECNNSRGTRETPGIRPTILVLAVREDPVNILSRLIFVSGS
ncbi:hypothetical protein L1987_23493 [Smallanthus sonchifolius]|uniref:Uncharacterized protein n=1 Tax=Smallanthus sonchifolius TaxID=185202 RepID=A0ACB9IH19_9ASTR|nr:hypothetical protein L1987_23493 [Smallanthus sonchifolius]